MKYKQMRCEKLMYVIKNLNIAKWYGIR